MFSRILQLLSVAAAQLSAGRGGLPIFSPTAEHRGPTAFRRDRSPGEPGRAGDKLARMAAEQRIGKGHPR